MQSADSCEARVIVHIQCSGLRDRDVIGRSDPFACVYLDSRVSCPGSAAGARAPNPERAGGPRDPRWERIGLTETRPNNTSPVFARSFHMPYFFERAQRIAVDVFDRDSPQDEPLSMHDFLGCVEVAMPKLVRSRGGRLQKPLVDRLHPDTDCGTIILIVEEEPSFKKLLHLDVAIEGLKRKYMGLGKVDPPHLTVSRRSAGSVAAQSPTSLISPASGDRASADASDWIIVAGPFASKVGPGGKSSFVLDPIVVNLQRLCLGSESTSLRFELSDEKRGRVIGQSVLTLEEWRVARKIPIQAMSATTRSVQRPVGQLVLHNVHTTVQNSFLDYVGAGYEMSLVLAVDFTASNGNPLQPGSLHYLDPLSSNEYESAIQSVGEILAQYDSDQKFPAYGFGAKLPPEYRVPSHCFSLTGENDAICDSIDGVLERYRQTLYNVRAAGPTVFAEIISAAIRHVREGLAEGEQTYTIMLIITDGVINDIDDTVEQIVKASSLPLSIVIVGVGNADFSDMNMLDGDETRLSESAERDIVQFVPFRQYQGAPEILAAKVLEEVPDQFMQYMNRHNILPPVVLDPG